MKPNKAILVIILSLLCLILGWYLRGLWENKLELASLSQTILRRPLERYTIENLSQAAIPQEPIEIADEIGKQDTFTSNLFYISLDPTLKGTSKKKVSGLINTPEGEGSFPLVFMLRGYVDPTIYKTGVGTQRAGEFFAQNGFITVSPDFLGYASSDKESSDIFETRFQTYTTALTVLNSLSSIAKWDKKNLFIWGHSNGGQIALTLLEATGRDIPTVLWAPVSKPFPYSILYYTDESEDRGKLIRGRLSEFEKYYNPDLFAIDLYYGRIKAPIELHQGTGDDAVPVEWSDELTKALKKEGVEVEYFSYPGADHNLNPAWNQVVARNLAFYKAHLTD